MASFITFLSKRIVSDHNFASSHNGNDVALYHKVSILFFMDVSLLQSNKVENLGKILFVSILFFMDVSLLQLFPRN
jgi:hypothetical protein